MTRKDKFHGSVKLLGFAIKPCKNQLDLPFSATRLGLMGVKLTTSHRSHDTVVNCILLVYKPRGNTILSVLRVC